MYFSYMHLWGLYTVAKFQIHIYSTFRDMNFYPVTVRRTDGRTESDAYESTVQYAQVGSKTTLDSHYAYTQMIAGP